MTVAPLIAMKSSQVKSFDAVGRELDRRAHTYANDVDQSGRHIGYRCRAEDERPVPLEKAVERRMGELKTKRKVRENQVRAMGFIVSSNDALDEKTAREFLDRSINWFGARYGYENLLAAQIHLDEGTPHAHIWIAPVIHDAETGFDRLCAKELFAPDKRRKNAEGKWEVTAQGTMSRLQEDFWEQVAKPYGYERPMRHELRAKGYRSLDAYKVQVGTTRALKSEIETLEGARDKAKHIAVTAKRELDGLERQRVETRAKLGAVTEQVDEKRAQAAEIDRRIAEKMAEIDRLDAAQMRRDAEREIKELDKRKECLRQEVEEMEAATPSLSEGVRTLWKARSDGSREEELGSAIEGLRGRISDLSSQIADCNGRAEGIERGLPALRARYRELAERFNDTRSRVEQALGRLREVPNTLSEWAHEIARRLGKRVYDPNSLEHTARQAREVAHGMSRERGWEPQNRGWSR